MNNDRNKSYLEWCEIVKQTPNDRDEIIFITGATFRDIDRSSEIESMVVTDDDYVMDDTIYSDWYKCPNCKGMIAEDYYYCQNCGKAIEWDLKEK